MTKTARKPAVESDTATTKALPKQVQLVEKLYIKLHKDEVWIVSFSNDGERLASSGADKSTIIYETDEFAVLHILTGHSAGIGSLSWSPDDSKLVTCSQDYTAKLWDTTTGECLETLKGFDGPITSCSWLPDGEHLVTTSLDRFKSLCLWSIDGMLVHTFALDDPIAPILGSAILPGGNLTVATFDNKKNIYIHDIQSKMLVRGSSFEVDLSSMCVSKLGKPEALFLRTDGLIEMVDVRTMEMVKVFKLKSCGNFVIKATFGGENEEFVASGSEDGDIYIWGTESGRLLAKQKAHTPPTSCNSIAWNPKVHGMVASAGDDHTVRIWIVNKEDEKL